MRSRSSSGLAHRATDTIPLGFGVMPWRLALVLASSAITSPSSSFQLFSWSTTMGEGRSCEISINKLDSLLEWVDLVSLTPVSCLHGGGGREEREDP